MVVAAPKPEKAFVGSIASPPVVAHIIEEKYVMGVPLYRQEKQWARRGVNLSRQNMPNRVIHAADNWFEPIYNRMKECLLEENIIHADETGLQVLQEPGKKPNPNPTCGFTDPDVMDRGRFFMTRAAEHPIRFLSGFSGYLISDGYAAYGRLSDVTNAGCWAHARRKFDEAIKVAEEAVKKIYQNKLKYEHSKII